MNYFREVVIELDGTRWPQGVPVQRHHRDGQQLIETDPIQRASAAPTTHPNRRCHMHNSAADVHYASDAGVVPNRFENSVPCGNPLSNHHQKPTEFVVSIRTYGRRG